uniref:Uncharacterized protein n=1 Tax=Caenorhabditis japonica TaxID=281687 RepID=A0A8R1HML7_CAEJA
MSTFDVYEEHCYSEKQSKVEFACQTEEIALSEQSAQTVIEALPKEENSKNARKDEEIEFFETVVSNYRTEIDRFKQINDKMEKEKSRNILKLEEKQAEYNRLFEIANEKLEKSHENVEDTEKEEEEDNYE